MRRLTMYFMLLQFIVLFSWLHILYMLLCDLEVLAVIGLVQRTKIVFEHNFLNVALRLYLNPSSHRPAG